MREYQMDGLIYEVEWVHGGQYHPYGDSFEVIDVKTTNKDPKSILELMKVFFKYDVPLKKDWNYNNINDYFRGYCQVEPIEGGFRYTKCEPYTD